VSEAEKPADTRQPDTIENEIEATRARLADTIDQLAVRANPKNIIAREIDNVRAFFLDAQGDPRSDNIAKVAGGVVGAVVLIVVIRRLSR